MINKNILLVFIVLISIVIGIGIGFIVPYERANNLSMQSDVGDVIVRDVPILGVTNDGKGVVGSMTVEVKPGSGLVLVNVNDLLADYHTQLSARTAVAVAGNFTGVPLYNRDIIYNMDVNASVVAGPSAGVAMAVGAIATLQNKKIKPGVFMTGAIQDNGKIVSVGGIREKASAAKSAGGSLFLIPKADYFTGYSSYKECRDVGVIHYCAIDYKPDRVNVNKLYGIDVLEVDDISDAVGVALV